MHRIREMYFKSRKPSGFTLIEMLVVITIIMILMAALMGVYGMVLASSKRTATTALVVQLNAALNAYAVAFDSFPPNPTGTTQDDGSLWLYLNGPTGRGIIANPGTPRQKQYAAFMPLDKRNIKAIGEKLVVVDAWGEPIHYFNAKAYVDNGGAAANVYNPSGVDIYSTGPDKKKDPDLIEPGSGAVKERSKMKLIDDITNF